MAAKTQQAAPPAAAPQERTLPMQYDVRIHSIHPTGTCRASASVNINGCFAIRGVKVMEAGDRLFVSMPSYRAGNGEYKDICFPCSKEARVEFDSAVFDAYRQALTQGQGQTQQAAQASAPRQEQNAQQMATM